MDIIETYLFLFTNSLFAGIIFPLRSETVYNVLVIFGEYNLFIITAIALTASLIAFLINYYLGVILKRIFKKKRAKISQKKLAKYFLPFLLLSWLDFFGAVMCILAGFLRIKLKIFLALTSFAKLGFYLWIIF